MNNIQTTNTTWLAQLGRVLLVDDDVYNLMLTSNIIKNWGVQYDTALDGVEAIEKLSYIKYDLLLLDLQMPKADGIEVANFLKKQHSENKYIPIILCTTLRLEEDYIKELKVNLIEDYLFKPFNENILKASIQNIFEKKKQTR
jgi:CheY-like chemotaxis protein